jgi:CPA1 family monovalent cation:H+ antiporter
MKLFNILVVLITLSAVFSCINYRFIKLPTTIGVMAISLLGSLGIALLGPLGFGLEKDALRLLDSIDFDETLLHGMLSFLLFAGALRIDLDRLAHQKWITDTLATVGTVGSTLIIRSLAYLVLDWLTIGILGGRSFIY